ncbi:MAG: hypothetical protein CME61_00515 [Halobacteriovoraceae bacterium]|nr:hypothetical protein [Halobacteriovoraceae bacterium]|tara:strand:+ start:239 stop:1414 length:1176 start_codon:yes stop_codon:yes gene_type:complete
MNSPIKPIERIEKLTGKEFFRPQGKDLLAQIFYDFRNWAKNKKVIIVGGTNGKGEVCYYLEKILIDNGKSTALFTSPHLHKINERFRFNSELLPSEKIQQNLDSFEKKYPGNHIQLSFFELIFWIFLNQAKFLNSEYLILEVGLGGRLDVTNMIDPDISIITNISRDHTEILGNRYDQILKEKLGITRSKVPLICGVELNYLKNKVKIDSRKRNFDVTFVNKAKNFHLKNISTARTAIDKLNEYYSTCLEITKNFNEPAKIDPRRLTIKKENACVDFLGSHNLDGHRAVLKSDLEIKDKYDLIIMNFSNRPENEISNILSLYINNGYDFVINGRKFFKSCPLEKLEGIITRKKHKDIKILKDTTDFLSTFNKNYNVLWIGSYYSHDCLNEL